MSKTKRVALVLLGLLTVRVVAVFGFADHGEEEARLAYLAERIDHHDLGVVPGHPFDGEWRLTTLSMSVVAATNLTVRRPTTRVEHARQISGWVKLMSSEEVRDYETRQWGASALTTLERADGHAGYLGHLALALDAACFVGAERDEVLHRQIIDALSRRVANARDGLIETYPGELYVPDNVVVLAALKQFDVCMGTTAHAEVIANWERTVRAKWVDPENGVLVFAPGQHARGSGAAWNSFYLPMVSAGFAAEQSEAMWKAFGDSTFFGAFGGIREGAHAGDVDSGPLVFGVSPAATGFALADAARRGRVDRLRILHTAELVGVSFGDRYLTAPLVGDAIVLAALTAVDWEIVESSQNDYYGVVTTPYDASLPRRSDL